MAAPIVKSVVLPSGAKMPVLGLGVFLAKPGEEAYNAVLTALKLGYRHIDSAREYKNEADVGRAVRDSGVPREQVFVTSKLLTVDGKWSYEQTVADVKESIDAFGIGYIDLYLLHAPAYAKDRDQAWRALEDMQSEGLVKDIGVSNFGEHHIQKLAKTWRVQPAVNQIELHPFYQHDSLIEYCARADIHIQAYTPLTRGQRLNDQTLVEVAKEANATVAQVLIAWSLQKHYTVLPKSVHESRILENLDAVKLELTLAQMVKLDALDEDKNLAGWDPIRGEYPPSMNIDSLD